MDETIFVLLNSIISIWWGVGIFYAMITGHCLNNGFWAIFASFLIMVGILMFSYYFIFPIQLMNEYVLNFGSKNGHHNSLILKQSLHSPSSPT